MGDSLGFIFRWFYYYFGSGCIVNIYVLCILFAYEKVEFLPDHMALLGRINFSTNVSILIFMFTAIIIGMLIEVFFHLLLRYKRNGKIKPLVFIIKIISKLGPEGACRHYWKRQAKEEPVSHYNDFQFMYNPKTRRLYNENEVYSVMQAAASRIAKEPGNDVAMSKELFYMMQDMFFSSILIGLVSLLAALYIAIFNSGSWTNFGVFYIKSFIVSAVLIVLTGLMAWSLTCRYIHKIAEWYIVFELHEKTVGKLTKADSYDTKDNA